MGAALSCQVCRKNVTDSGVWRFGHKSYVCTHCYNERKHTDFVLDSTENTINSENARRIAAEKEIHRLLPKEIRNAEAARIKFEKQN